MDDRAYDAHCYYEAVAEIARLRADDVRARQVIERRKAENERLRAALAEINSIAGRPTEGLPNSDLINRIVEISGRAIAKTKQEGGE